MKRKRKTTRRTKTPSAIELHPSAAGRWVRCAGSVALAAQFERTSSVAANEGTAAHELLGMCMSLQAPPFEFEGMDINGFTVDDEMMDAVSIAYEYVLEQVMLHGYTDIRSEEKLNPGQRIGRENFKGTTDVVLTHRTRCHIVDFKYGKGLFVPVKDNYQLISYAVGAFEPYYEEYELTIIQPRMVKKPQTIVLSKDEMIAKKTELLEAVMRVDGPNPPFEAGEKQCQFCPAAGSCPTLKDYNLGYISTDIAVLHGEGLVTDEELADALNHIPLLNLWVKAVQRHATEVLAAGKPVPGWKLVKAEGHRQWKEGAERTLLDLISEEDLYTEPELISPAQAKKLLKGGDKKIIETLVFRPDRGAVLATEDDPRPSPATIDFEDLEDG